LKPDFDQKNKLIRPGAKRDERVSFRGGKREEPAGKEGNRKSSVKGRAADMRTEGECGQQSNLMDETGVEKKTAPRKTFKKRVSDRRSGPESSNMGEPVRKGWERRDRQKEMATPKGDLTH